jgi:transcriptional regulator with XRE-family HTH domain
MFASWEREGSVVTIDRPTFGANLVRQRQDMGFSTYAVAQALGCGLTQVRRWERGEMLPSLDSFVALCAVLSCCPDDLLEGAVRLERWEITEEEGGAA